MDKYNHWLGKLFAWLNNTDNYCMTIRQTAYYSCSKEIVDNDPIWRKHENYHKVQWENEGTLKYACKYGYYLLRYGYFNNPYEVEARKHSIL